MKCVVQKGIPVGSKRSSEGKQKDVGRAMVMTTEMKKADISNKSLAGYIQDHSKQCRWLQEKAFAWR